MNSCNFPILLFVFVAIVLYNGVDGRIQDLRRGKVSNYSNGVTDLAICRTQNSNGALAEVAVYNPTIMDQQYSSARFKLENGPDSIEAGWRVDPTLYGDHQTRLYIRTDSGQSHCFNTQCPGFVTTNPSFSVDAPLAQVSQRGGPTYGIFISIAHDLVSGTWNLTIGEDKVQVGYWPKSIFSNSGLPDINFGGEVFSPDSATKPRMGAGEYLEKDTSKDAFFSNLLLINDSGSPDYPVDLECSSTDRNYYEIKDEMYVSADFQYLVFYGGP